MGLHRAFIVAAKRTAIARAGSGLRSVPEHGLVAPVITELLASSGLSPADVDEVVLGNAAGPGGNVARVSLLEASLPHSIPATTIDQQCSSALAAIDYGASLVRLGKARCVVAGGVESVSTAPWKLSRPVGRTGMPQVYTRARFTPAPMNDPDMGVAAEAVAREYGVSREAQDSFALSSHRRASEARAAGAFREEIVPVGTADGVFDTDECPRPNLSERQLAALRPAFVVDGTVTAGNTCPLNDGASAVLIVDERWLDELGAAFSVEYLDHRAGATDPELLGVAAAPACEKLLAAQQGLALDDIALIEFNEAFASQTIASLRLLGVDPERVNLQGGAIALGHPYGASGAILITRLFHQLMAGSHPPGTLALALMAAAGGVGAATLLRSHGSAA